MALFTCIKTKPAIQVSCTVSQNDLDKNCSHELTGTAPITDPQPIREPHTVELKKINKTQEPAPQQIPG